MLHLRPRQSLRQKLLAFDLSIQPEFATFRDRVDYYGNEATFVAIEAPHRELVVISKSEVQVDAPVLPDPAHTVPWETVQAAVAAKTDGSENRPGEFIYESRYVPIVADIREYARESFPVGKPLMEALLDLTQRIFRDFKFDPDATNVSTPVQEVFMERKGVCQDFAHLALSCLRSLGVPARYVSGYLETIPPPGKERLIGADASHAWVAAWCPGYGWIDADPTNNLLPLDRHITVAWGRDFMDVSPVRGLVVGGGGHALDVSVDVAPVGNPGIV